MIHWGGAEKRQKIVSDSDQHIGYSKHYKVLEHEQVNAGSFSLSESFFLSSKIKFLK